MKRAIIIAAILLLGAARAGAQVDSSCLVLWQDSPIFPGPGFEWFNHDSIKVDICSDGQYLQEFAKDSFTVCFKYYIIPVSDSVALYGEDTSPHTWRDLDTEYSALRNAFDSLEQEFGSIVLQHLYDGPGDTGTDEKVWVINFTSYRNIDTVNNALLMLPDVNLRLGVEVLGTPIFAEGVSTSSQMSLIAIYPEPASTEVTISGISEISQTKFFDLLGRELNLPIRINDTTLTLDVSNQPDGIIYGSNSSHVFKLLIHH